MTQSLARSVREMIRRRRRSADKERERREIISEAISRPCCVRSHGGGGAVGFRLLFRSNLCDHQRRSLNGLIVLALFPF